MSRRAGKKSQSARSGGVQRVYGIHAVSAFLQRRAEAVTQIYWQSGRDDQRLAELKVLASQLGLPQQQRSREQLNEWLGGERHQGVVAEVRSLELWRESDIDPVLDAAGSEPLVLVLDGVTDPHNLGACLRSANGAGVDLVIAPRDKAAGLTPAARKVACGAAEETPFVQVGNLARTLRRLAGRGIWIVGLADAEDHSLYQGRLGGPLALVLGAEDTGLRRLTREHCDEIVALPMRGGVSSLNVSVAAGVCLYEVLRQRTAGAARFE
ncbi:MAG: 23S rRNA (guanosine(2251)-2'-O)-methyltransferase RlmB [Pseudomonadota bacterium]